jgi:hypothetical protein
MDRRGQLDPTPSFMKSFELATDAQHYGTTRRGHSPVTPRLSLVAPWLSLAVPRRPRLSLFVPGNGSQPVPLIGPRADRVFSWEILLLDTHRETRGMAM